MRYCVTTSSRNVALYTPIQKPRINQQITAPELRVIDAKGKNLGVMPREQALALTRPEEGLDLIEIAPSAKPPVVRLMSFDKYRYEAEKRERRERLSQRSKGRDFKQIQISARSAENDLRIKAQKLNEFLAEGHRIEIQLRLRGREKGNKEWALKKLNGFLAMITPEHRVVLEPRFAGRGMVVQVSKK